MVNKDDGDGDDDGNDGDDVFQVSSMCQQSVEV